MIYYWLSQCGMSVFVLVYVSELFLSYAFLNVLCLHILGKICFHHGVFNKELVIACTGSLPLLNIILLSLYKHTRFFEIRDSSKVSHH